MMEFLTLGELTASTRPICYGVLKPGIEDLDGVPLVRVKDISSNYFNDQKLFKIGPELDNEFKRSKLNGGEVLLSIQGTVGKVAICPKEYAGANISRTIAVIEPDNRLFKNYLRYYFIYMDIYKKHYSTGSTRASLNIAYLRKLKIPLPPLNQQKQIAKILDTADAYRQKTKALISKYDELTQSLFLDMFGDPVTNPMGWEKVALGSLSKRIVVGHVGPTSDGYTESGIPFLRTQNVRRNFINYKGLVQITSEFHNKLKKSRIFANDVLISRVGVNRGMAAVVPNDLNEANCANVVIVGSSELLNSYYLSFFLNKSFGTKPEYGYSVGSAQGVVNTSIVKKWPIFEVSLELQNQFAERLKAIEQQKKAAQQSLQKAEDLFNSLLQKAFKGELVK